MRMLIDIDTVQEGTYWNFPIILKLQKCMIDSRLPFLSDILSDIVNEKSIIESILVREVIFDGSYLLSCKENSTLIQKQIESMLRNSSRWLSIILRNEYVDMEEILVDPSE